MKRALIVGSRGQDGTLLSDLLEREKYEVHGLIRAGQKTRRPRETAIDLLDETAVRALIGDLKPDEIYYLAAYHHSSESARPGATELFRKSFDVNVYGLLNVLESVKEVSSKSRILYAASSHVFGDGASSPQDEGTPLAPTNIYGISKAAGILACRFARTSYETFVSVAILYNHESRLRGPEFVSRKIVQGALDIQHGKSRQLLLRDLSAEVDWGYAADSVDAMRRILRLENPGDFVVATGERHSVREFVEIVFELAGLDWQHYVKEDATLFSSRSGNFVGDSTKLRKLTGWRPTVTFREMVTDLWKAASSGESR